MSIPADLQMLMRRLENRAQNERIEFGVRLAVLAFIEAGIDRVRFLEVAAGLWDETLKIGTEHFRFKS